MMIFTDPEQRRLVRFVVRQSMETLDNLPLSQRADLLEGAALLLAGAEADEASAAAKAIRDAEAQQLQFLQLILK